MKQDIDEARRQAVARGWASTSLDQASYAAQHGISARTLREWVRHYGVTDRPVAKAVAILDDIITQLQAMRAALVAEAACQVGGAVSEDAQADEHSQGRHAGTEVESAASTQTLLDELVLRIEDPAQSTEAVNMAKTEEPVRPVTLPQGWMHGGLVGGF
jgi:hypothetical protein